MVSSHLLYNILVGALNLRMCSALPNCFKGKTQRLVASS